MTTQAHNDRDASTKGTVWHETSPELGTGPMCGKALTIHLNPAPWKPCKNTSASLGLDWRALSVRAADDLLCLAYGPRANWKVFKDAFHAASHVPLLHKRLLPDPFTSPDNPYAHAFAFKRHERNHRMSAFGGPGHQSSPVELMAHRLGASIVRREWGMADFIDRDIRAAEMGLPPEWPLPGLAVALGLRPPRVPARESTKPRTARTRPRPCPGASPQPPAPRRCRTPLAPWRVETSPARPAWVICPRERGRSAAAIPVPMIPSAMLACIVSNAWSLADACHSLHIHATGHRRRDTRPPPPCSPVPRARFVAHHGGCSSCAFPRATIRPSPAGTPCPPSRAITSAGGSPPAFTRRPCACVSASPRAGSAWRTSEWTAALARTPEGPPARFPASRDGRSQ